MLHYELYFHSTYKGEIVIRIPSNSLNNIVIKPIKPVKSSRSIRAVPNFTDYMYKLEQNKTNEIIASKYSQNRNIVTNYTSDTEYDSLILASNLKQSIQISKNRLQYNDSIISTDFRSLEKSVDHIKTSPKISLEDVQQILDECKTLILDFASPSALLNASYLLSFTAVMELLKPKIDDE